MSVIKRKAGSEDIVKSVLEFDEVPTEGSHNLVESGAVAQAIGNLGHPLQWKGPATVSELNTGITGIQPGWTYTLTDAGTLTDGSIAVDVGDEVAWTKDGEWFKVGPDSTTEDIQKMIDDAVYSSEIAILSNITPAANTLRFAFSKKDYDPTVAGVGSSGTWTKKNTKFTNVWDWTNTNTSWAAAFGGGNTTTPGAFADYENNPVKVIAAGDTSSVTDFSRFFQNCYAITEICQVDTSKATTVFLMFSHCENCTKFPDMDFSSATETRAVYQSCYKMVSAPNIIFPTDHTYSLQNFFTLCVGLENIPLYDTSMCIDMQNMFDMYGPEFPHLAMLQTVPKFNTSKVTTMRMMFRNCSKLKKIPDFDCSNLTNISMMFGSNGIEMHIESVPNLDYSKITRIESFMKNNVDLEEIPEMNIEANVTRCDEMFKNCSKIKSGQKALYDKLSAIGTITNHVDCFKDCGSATEEGRAELAQIPVSWGGTMVEP